jgi:hypothetical protein
MGSIEERAVFLAQIGKRACVGTLEKRRAALHRGPCLETWQGQVLTGSLWRTLGPQCGRERSHTCTVSTECASVFQPISQNN